LSYHYPYCSENSLQAAKQTVITDDEKAELAKILGQNSAPSSAPEPEPAPVQVPVAEPVAPVPSDLSVSSNEVIENLSNGCESTEVPVELQNSHQEEKSDIVNEIVNNQDSTITNGNGESTPTGNGEIESASTGNDVTKNNFEEEVVSGVVYIRTNSRLSESSCQMASEASSADPVVGNVQPEEKSVNEVPKENGVVVNAANEVTVIESSEKPVSTTKTKRRKKTSGSGTGIRNRANKAKEVQTIHMIEEKLKGFE
jgi:hypothetical protein